MNNKHSKVYECIKPFPWVEEKHSLLFDLDTCRRLCLEMWEGTYIQTSIPSDEAFKWSEYIREYSEHLPNNYNTDDP